MSEAAPPASTSWAPRWRSVLFVLTSGRAGGGQEVALAIARGLHGRGVRITAAIPEDGPYVGQFSLLGRSEITGPIRSVDPRSLRVLRSIAAKERCDCVYTHTGPSQEIAAWMSTVGTTAHWIAHRHLTGSFSAKPVRRRAQEVLWSKALRSAASVMAVSEMVADEVRRRGGPCVSVIPNGVKLAPTRGTHSVEDAPVVGFVGRFDHNKRLEDFLEAAATTLRTTPGMRFVVVGASGDWGYERRCRDLVISHGMEQAVTFCDVRSGAAALMAKFDIFVLPSVLEGHPLVLLEAMSHSCAVVATAIPGVVETVTDGVDGYLVPPRRPDRISALLARLAADPGERIRMGEAARATVASRFTVERMVGDVLEHFAAR